MYTAGPSHYHPFSFVSPDIAFDWSSCILLCLALIYSKEASEIQSDNAMDMEQWTGSKLRKEYVKAVYCHPAYLTYMQSTSYEMLA